MTDKPMDPEFARWLLANDRKHVEMVEHRLLDDYDDETGNVPGVTRVPAGGTMVLTDDVRLRAIAALTEENPDA